MDIFDKIKPSAPKRILLFLASSIWGFASFKVLNIGLTEILSFKSIWLNLLISLVGFYFFFKFVFLKICQKHINRIINSQSEYPCIFSFFDLKGYGIMFFMISLGIALRSIRIIPALYLGTFYISLGLSLLLASIYFLYFGIRYDFAKIKYLQENTKQVHKENC